jgi:deoxyribonuclease V
MIACIDVGYQEKSALAACITISDWKASAPVASHSVAIQNVEEYVPGAFYKRELPCIEAMLKELGAKPDVIVIDGYVWLDAQGKKGLGAHLFELLNGEIPVIGVAKTSFATATNAIEVFRGQSSRPLWVTAIGTNEFDAAKHVQSMHGNHRIPTILTLVDRLSKSSSETSPQTGETG